MAPEPAPRVVVDASVVVKWFVREDDRDRAIMLREAHLNGDVLLSAPDLVVYEVGNALRNCPGFVEEDVRAAVEALFGLHMELMPPTPDAMTGAVREAFGHDMTVYDAVYLSLADVEAGHLVTADEKLHRKIGEDPRVCLLSSDRFIELVQAD